MTVQSSKVLERLLINDRKLKIGNVANHFWYIIKIDSHKFLTSKYGVLHRQINNVITRAKLTKNKQRQDIK